jgi:hypothetical protein
MADDAQPKSPDAFENALANLLVERSLRATALPIKVVAFMDMLGFGSLVTKHPAAFEIEIDPKDLSVGTSASKSSERFGRFHAVLDRLAMNNLDASRPERMMIFSDCAFAVYDNALQAALSLCETMRRFLYWAIPVRMCIAKGTCHFERFSIESFQSFNLTRSMFYGSGIVAAVRGEEEAGSGCRIFLHPSLELEDMTRIKSRLEVLPVPTSSAYAEYELNYLHELAHTDGDPVKEDLRLFGGLSLLRSELRDPIKPEVLAQYDDSFALFNRMRKQLGRYEIRPPRFDGAGNPLEPDLTQ